MRTAHVVISMQLVCCIAAIHAIQGIGQGYHKDPGGGQREAAAGSQHAPRQKFTVQFKAVYNYL